MVETEEDMSIHMFDNESQESHGLHRLECEWTVDPDVDKELTFEAGHCLAADLTNNASVRHMCVTRLCNYGLRHGEQQSLNLKVASKFLTRLLSILWHLCCAILMLEN